MPCLNEVMEMKRDLLELIRKLSNACGVSGYEFEIGEVVKAELEDVCDEIREDKMGNIVCVKNGGERKLMVAAHVDEIGFVVKHIDDKGFLRIAPVGGWFSQIALGQRVILYGKRRVYGVIGSKPPHLMKDDERKKVIQIRDMFVDVGAKSRDEVLELGLEVGTPVVVDREVAEMAGNRVTGKAFDNRAGVAAMIRAMKTTESRDTIYAVATVQEEVGLKGAKVAAYALEPDAAVVIDSCVATDFPGGENAHMDIKLGGGPAITIMDASGRGLITSPKVLKWLRETAEENSIPYQLEVVEGGTTDATAIHLTKAGIPSGVVSIPARYIHSPVEVIDLGDVDMCAKLVAKALETAGRYF